jgi:hypothetical protein
VADDWVDITEPEAFGGEWEDVPVSDLAEVEGLPTGGGLKEFGKGVIDSYLLGGKGAVGTAEFVTKAMRKIPTWDWVYSGIEALTGKEFEEEQKEVMGKIEAAREPFQMTHQGVSAQAGRILGNAVGYMSLALAGGYTAGPVGAAMVGFSIEGQDAYDKAVAAGATEEQAQTERLIVGSINAGIEAFQIGRLMKFHKTGKHSVKAFVQAARAKAYRKMGEIGKGFGADILRHSIEEGLEEFAQEGVSMAVPAALRGDYPMKPDGSPDWLAVGERLGAAGVGGAFAGGVLGAGGAVVAGDIMRPGGKRIEEIAGKIRESDISDNAKARMIGELEKLLPEEGQLEIPESTRRVLALADDMAVTLKEMQKERPELQEYVKEGRAKSFGKQAKILAEMQADDPLIVKQIAQGVAKGELRKDYPDVVEKFSQEDWRTLIQSINEATDINQGERRALWECLDDLFINKKPPAEARLKAFDKFFGTDVYGSTKNLPAGKFQSRLHQIADVMNIPKAILASFDVSMPLRQAWHYTMAHPIKSIPSWGKMLKAFCSERYSKFVEMELQTNENYRKFVDAGLEQTKAGSRTEGEEYFQGELAHKIPGIGPIVKASERAAVTYMNNIRMQAANHFYDLMGSPDIQTIEKTVPNVPDEINHLEWNKGEKRWSAKNLDEKFWNWYNTVGKENVADIGIRVSKDWQGNYYAYTSKNITSKSKTIKETIEKGTKVSAKQFQDMIDFVNHSTSRGGFKGRAGKWFKKWSPELGAVLWTPKMIIGKVQSIADLRKPEIRGLVACETVRAFGGATLAAMLLALGFGGKIEKDPRSSDFGKVVVGKTRLDMFGTYLPMFRLIAQMVVGERKAATTGRISDVDRRDIVTRFLRSKLNPMAGVVSDIWTGQTFLGKKMKWEGDFLAEYIAEHITPLFLQDLKDAVKYQGLDASILVAPLAVHGAGAATYEPTPRSDEVELKNHYAHQAYGTGWDELGAVTQDVLRVFRPDIVKAEEKTRRAREDYTFIGKLAQEEQDAGKRVYKKLSKNIQKEMDRLAVDIGGLRRQLKSDWYLNKKRYNQYQREVKTMLEKSIPRLINNPSWNVLNDDVQQVMLQTTIDQCKKLIRQRIVMQANIKDLERRR